MERVERDITRNETKFNYEGHLARVMFLKQYAKVDEKVYSVCEQIRKIEYSN